MAAQRSSAPEVRNPLLALPAMAQLRQLPLAQRAPLAALLEELSTQAHTAAERSWRQRKGPMAAYWRAVGVYARHTARGLATGQERAAWRAVQAGPWPDEETRQAVLRGMAWPGSLEGDMAGLPASEAFR